MARAMQRPGAGFTLIEIMVALVIFAIIMTALFASFRTGMRAYSLASEHGNQQQLGRFAVNSVAEDLRNIYYKPESQYNVARRQQEATIDANNEGLGTGAGGRDVLDENLPDLGPPIDLSFTGEDGGEIDQLSFVRHLDWSLEDNRPLWGLARITYYIIDGKLYRALDDITRPETDEDGNVIPKVTQPQVDKLADNCLGFDIKYGYYYDEDWHLASNWDSNGAQYRNPPSEEDDDILDTVGSNASPDVEQSGASAQLQQQVQQQEEQQRADELPGWVEITFAFGSDPENPDRRKVYKQSVVMANKYSNETYVPEDEEDELKGARARGRGRSGNSNAADTPVTNGPGQGVGN